jgi:hypothetical protein
MIKPSLTVCCAFAEDVSSIAAVMKIKVFRMTVLQRAVSFDDVLSRLAGIERAVTESPAC